MVELPGWVGFVVWFGFYDSQLITIVHNYSSFTVYNLYMYIYIWARWE
jgi:hypothetical protein